ncbi:putative centromeric histone CENP-A [Daphnia pulex]|uniref:Putative centromeric histone CENP-A n=1 Tax=Daphnia pulex TaxID=6669 RepID=E9HP51_DAPPU|nr:putative centromeric histone CENP-A [Daphnia pulex]|eukprot:EFX66448.1 putative centromeric histone CENP-A [Daphnia pulex]
MARLKKSNAGTCASNLPITRSQTVVCRAAIVGAKAKTPAQAPPKSSSFRDSTGKKRYRPGSKALKEIRHYQRGTGLLIPRSPFTRVIKQISQELTGNSAPLIRLRFTSEALECLQVASEAMVIQLFEDSVWTMVNAKRLTLMVQDIQLVRRIRGNL